MYPSRNRRSVARVLRNAVNALLGTGKGRSADTLPSPHSPNMGVEQLEGRLLLTRTLYVDFGDYFPAGGLDMSVGQIRGALGGGGIEGPDLRGGAAAWVDGTNIHFGGTAGNVTFDYNGDGSVNSLDYTSIRANAMSVVRRVYAPFDVDVELAPALNNTNSGTYETDINTTLSGAPSGAPG